MGSMKVLLLLHLPPPVHGSSVMGNYMISSSLIRRAMEIRHINLSSSREIRDVGRVGWLKFSMIVQTFVLLLKELQRFKPDSVYFALSTTGFGFFRDFILIMLVKAYRKPIIYHFHNKGISQFQKHRVYDRMYKMAFSKATAIVLSERLKADVAAYFEPSRIAVCSNGLPDYGIVPDQTAEHGEPVILMISNLIETKGVYVLLDACRILKEEGLPFQCEIAGYEGDVTGKMLKERMSSMQLGDRVRYLGPVQGKEKWRLLQKATVFAFPTYYHRECFPLVLIEALQCGLPVVTTSEGGIADMISEGRNGFITDKKNPQDLADKIRKILQDNELRGRMSGFARQTYEDHYTLAHFEKSMHDILIRD